MTPNPHSWRIPKSSFVGHLAMLQPLIRVLLAFCLLAPAAWAQKSGSPRVTLVTQDMLPGVTGDLVPGFTQAIDNLYQRKQEAIASRLSSDFAKVSLKGGPSPNFVLKFEAFYFRDCEPCRGEDAKARESFRFYTTLMDVSTSPALIVGKWSHESAPWMVNGDPDPTEMAGRMFSDFEANLITAEDLKAKIQEVTKLGSAVLTFKPKDPSDERPMKADGKRRGEVRIQRLPESSRDHPLGEIPANPLTLFELECRFGALIDRDGREAKKVTFKGSEYVANPGEFTYDYITYDCAEICERKEFFTLKCLSQNGEDREQSLATLEEVFACTGYTLQLSYREPHPLYGQVQLEATWTCVQINVGKPGEAPVILDMGQAGNPGDLKDTAGKPLYPPYRIPMAEEAGMVHLSMPIRTNEPASHHFSTTGGMYAPVASTFRIDFREDFLTNPPEVIRVDQDVPGHSLCGAVLPTGVYLTWQFDLWANLPDLGPSQVFTIEATPCTNLHKVPGHVTARLSDAAVASMREGKPFTVTGSNANGASYTLTATSQK